MNKYINDKKKLCSSDKNGTVLMVEDNGSDNGTMLIRCAVLPPPTLLLLLLLLPFNCKEVVQLLIVACAEDLTRRTGLRLVAPSNSNISLTFGTATFQTSFNLPSLMPQLPLAPSVKIIIG